MKQTALLALLLITAITPSFADNLVGRIRGLNNEAFDLNSEDQGQDHDENRQLGRNAKSHARTHHNPRGAMQHRMPRNHPRISGHGTHSRQHPRSSRSMPRLGHRRSHGKMLMMHAGSRGMTMRKLQMRGHRAGHPRQHQGQRSQNHGEEAGAHKPIPLKMQRTTFSNPRDRHARSHGKMTGRQGGDSTPNMHDHEFDSRIVGGFEAEPGAYKFFASLDVGCGGSLITPDTILTAAHCGDYTVGTARIGSDDYSSGGEIRSVVSQCRHPGYDALTTGNDYMLLKLESPVDTNTYPVIELNRDILMPEHDDILTVIGFGLTSEGGDQSQKLLQVDVPMNSYELCNEQYGGTIDEGTQFCAGYVEGGKDSCQGDSGGPIFEMRGSTPVQVGVVSFG